MEILNEQSMNRLDQFSESRPLLFSVAYRMLGSVADAEDMVQETYVRWQTAKEQVASPRAYLTTMITRLCINYLESARVKREKYVGPWLPEPLLEEEHAKGSALADSLSVAFLLLLERLSPVERAVFLLREVFEFEYEEISRITGKNKNNCRQLFRRAKQKVSGSPFEKTKQKKSESQKLLNQFIQACSTGDLDSLISVLEEDITLYSDGGGKVAAALRPIQGSDRVARFIMGLQKKFEALALALRYEPAIVNGTHGILIYIDTSLNGVLTIEPGEKGIHEIYYISNPDKIKHIINPH
jgi:RNA polymerase sigma-70 factor (ECF subfamily)